MKKLARLRYGFSHLCEQKCRYSFRDTLNWLCSCHIEAKTSTHYFLYCHFYNLNDSEKNIPISFSEVSDNNLTSFLLYGNNKFDNTKTWKILLSEVWGATFLIIASVLCLCCHFYLLFRWRFCFTFSKSYFDTFSYFRVFSLVIALTFTFPLFKSRGWGWIKGRWVGIRSFTGGFFYILSEKQWWVFWQ